MHHIFRHPLVYSSAHFGPGSGDIWIDKVTCSGNEIDFNSCVDRYSERYSVSVKYHTTRWVVTRTHYRKLYRVRSNSEWGHHNCDHNQDVSIICSEFILKMIFKNAVKSVLSRSECYPSLFNGCLFLA